MEDHTVLKKLAGIMLRKDFYPPLVNVYKLAKIVAVAFGIEVFVELEIMNIGKPCNFNFALEFF